MAQKTIIANAKIVNEGRVFKGSVLVEDNFIAEVCESGKSSEAFSGVDNVFDAQGLYLFPGFIDTHVHFREPGLTHKADIYSESRAAAVGGVTSYCEMPNTKPPTTSWDLINEKFNIAKNNSIVNYSFFAGATNDNISQLLKLDYSKICGIKVFMGSSTGNMLVDNDVELRRLFSESPVTIATHCEDEAIIKAEYERFMNMYGDNAPFSIHQHVRNAKACYNSTKKAVDLAQDCGTRLHVTHISTKRELELFDAIPLANKKITAEACIPHLWFDEDDYESRKYRIKCNPSIKTRRDRNNIRKALNTGVIDSVATDHAPHLLSEKNQSYFLSPSGMPSIQFSATIMFDLVKQGIISLEIMAQKMAHAPATIFNIDKRGFIRQGYYADFALINPNKRIKIIDKNVVSKCGWTPFNGLSFGSEVVATMVNGKFVYNNHKIIEAQSAMQLNFNR
ncbi:MAG: dihydroorotase [Bacteroidales bacterium]|nr:dihydroorotase [Bacteroidales bacterium]